MREDIKKDIITIVRLMRIHPTFLLDCMRIYDVRDIRATMQTMLYSNELVLSSDRYLEIPADLKEL